LFVFNTTELLPPGVSVVTILDHLYKPDGPIDKDGRLFFQYMGLVEQPLSLETHVDDFAEFLLRIMDFDDQVRVICQRKKISFPMARYSSREDAESR
jgi:hypothetical protein